MKKILFTVLIFTMAACSAEDFNAGTKMSDPEINKNIALELKSAGIAYEIDSKGYINYNKKYSTIVEALILRELQKQVKKERKKYGFKFADDINPEVFAAYVHSKGINTENLILIKEENAIYWPKEQDEKIKSMVIPFAKEYQAWKKKQHQ